MPEYKVETFVLNYHSPMQKSPMQKFNKEIEDKISEYVQNGYRVFSHQISTNTYGDSPSKLPVKNPDNAMLTTQLVFIKED